jgi:hypothetical protein
MFLGFLSSLVILCTVWLIHVASEFLSADDGTVRQKLKSALTASSRLVKAEILAFFGFWFVAYAVFVVRTIYYDHAGLTWSLQREQAKTIELEKELARRQHIISPTDPFFSDVDHLMTAFRIFKAKTHDEPCVVRITAPKSAEGYAVMISSFSIAVDNCSTFGPMIGDVDPDEIEDTNIGMVPDAIVLHARKDDEAANALFVELSNQVHLVRSYDTGRANYQVPPQGYRHVVWLQVGSNVKWNSER